MKKATHDIFMLKQKIQINRGVKETTVWFLIISFWELHDQCMVTSSVTM